MTARPLLAALGLALALPSCVYVKDAPVPGASEGAWAEARDRATRTAKLYDVLDDVAFATATYQSPTVRAARVDRMAEWKGSLPAERQAALDREKAEAADGEEFLLAFFTDDRRANDLVSDKSTWRVALVVNGAEQALPVKISLVRRDPTLQKLYPFVTDFDTVYKVRFPRFPGEKPLAALPFTLRISGALGRLDLDFGPGPR
ncbi:MAG TPA: hypothetical protein VFM53_15620 [Anaeromyxobacteraceae bacterium]|nr:hypothetical protein [Anaeromyxobacteraceae bacterium]